MGVSLTTIAFITSLLQGSLCMDWTVMLPKSMKALSGSCLRIPCTFHIPASFDVDLLNCNHSGIWRKGSVTGQVVFISSQAKNIIQGDMIGDLREKNCTTVFNSFPEGYNDTYFFRLACTHGPKYTFNSGVYINSQTDAPPPELTPVGGVSERDHVRLQCSVPVPCPALPPTLSWLPVADSTQEVKWTQKSEDEPITMISSLTFTASPRHHNQTFTCSVSYPLAQQGSTKTSARALILSVQYAPRVTVATISPSGPVLEGRAVTLTCASDANPPVERYTWYRDIIGQVTRRAEGEVLLFLVSREESGVYLCEAHNRKGSQRSKPVAVEILIHAESSQFLLVAPYAICGVMVVLYVLTVIVDVYKYQSLSRRLKQIELKGKGEHTYSALKVSSIAPDYDQFQARTMPTAEAPCYENPIAMSTRGEGLA